MTTRFVARLLVTAVIACSSSRGARAQGGPEGTARLEETEQRLGPFSLGPLALPAHPFTVVLHGKRLPGSVDPDSETLASLEIRDGAGAVQHQETFRYDVVQGSFSETCSASAQPLTGGVAAGLLIGVGCLPSAPDSGDTWEIFGVVNGALVRFGKPFTTDGEMLDFIPTPVARSGKAVLIQPDVLQFRVWTGNFHVTVPVRVDWMQGRLMQGMRCLESTGQGIREGGCDVPVEVERVANEEEPTFVRLFVEAGEGAGIPRHVVVTRDARVEFLSAKVKLVWDESGDVIYIGVDNQDPWLKVRIDGKEGWIHTQEDFFALGVPQAG